MSAMDLTQEKRSAGSQQAAQARRIRAEVKESLTFSVDCLLDVAGAARTDGPEGRAIARMPVRDLLAAMPGVGPVRAAVLMERSGISPTRRVGGLGSRQLQVLASLINERARQRDRRSLSGAGDQRG